MSATLCGGALFLALGESAVDEPSTGISIVMDDVLVEGNPVIGGEFVGRSRRCVCVLLSGFLL
jgi:hypothetical protein